MPRKLHACRCVSGRMRARILSRSHQHVRVRRHDMNARNRALADEQVAPRYYKNADPNKVLLHAFALAADSIAHLARSHARTHTCQPTIRTLLLYLAPSICLSHSLARSHTNTQAHTYTRQQLSKRKRMEKIEPLYNRYEEKDAWRLSKRRG